MKNIWLKFNSFLIFLPFLLAKKAAGANLENAFTVVKDTVDKTYKTDLEINSILGEVVLLILSLIGAVFILFIVYAGYLWMTASGNEQKVDKAKEILRQSIIGVIVIVGAYVIAYFVINVFSAQFNT